MFRETLLESAPAGRKNNKRWPMAAAFMLELAIAAVVVVIPLLTTGVISVSAQTSCPTFLEPPPIRATPPTDPPSGPSSARLGRTTTVVTIATNSSSFHPFSNKATPDGDESPDPFGPVNPNRSGLPDGLIRGNGPAPSLDDRTQRIRTSNLSEGQLIYRVEPVYPRFGIRLQGEVRLHAIIAKDGSIQSLTVQSGQPLLAAAALDAVRQWRYRPYMLNGAPVEVDTFITVNFKAVNQ